MYEYVNRINNSQSMYTNTRNVVVTLWTVCKIRTLFSSIRIKQGNQIRVRVNNAPSTGNAAAGASNR